MARWMPCRAEAIASGLRAHSPSWRRLSQGRVMHTVLGVRAGSAITFGPRKSWPRVLFKETEGKWQVDYKGSKQNGEMEGQGSDLPVLQREQEQTPSLWLLIKGLNKAESTTLPAIQNQLKVAKGRMNYSSRSLPKRREMQRDYGLCPFAPMQGQKTLENCW